MDYEDYVPEFEYYDPEADIFSDELWDSRVDEWDPYSDWVYEGEYTDNYDDYWY